MKFPYFAVAAALLSSVTVLQAEVSPVRVRVEQVSKSDKEKDTKTQKRSLKLTVSNGGKVDFSGTVKFAFFGRKAGSNDVVQLDGGDQPVSIKAGGTEVIETAVSSASFTEARVTKGKKIEASGSKFSGYGVQVLDGTKVLAEAYDPVSVKEKMGTGPAASANP